MWHGGRASRLLFVLSLVALVAGCGPALTGVIADDDAGRRPAAASTAGEAPDTVPPAVPSATPSTAPAPSAGSSTAPTPRLAATPTTGVSVPIVPVVDFRSPLTSVSRTRFAAILAGTDKSFTKLELVERDAASILSALRLDPTAAGGRLVLAPSARALASDLAAHGSRLGIVRASEVGPAVRALGWAGQSLFGVDRVRSQADWPLNATLGAGAGGFDPGQTWTIVAAGDVMLDRGVYKAVKLDGLGIDFPFDGGTAKITSRYCCSSMGWTLPRVRRVDASPAIRRLLTGADLALVNLEGPAPAKARFHASGTVFSFHQSLLAGLDRAGIDWVSLGNNHIGDAGSAGVLQSIQALDRLGIEHGGAGATAAAARAPAIFTVGGTRVALLAYDAIAPSYWARASRPGSAQLSGANVRTDIRRARAAGADVVIVYPHWGVEYTARPTAAQRRLAHAMVDAGADLVVGSHAHWAGAMEVYRGAPIWYSLGNFVFDQTWSEPTEEGLVLELTFTGATLAQAWLRPTLILDGAQPNLLDPAGSGKVVLDRVFSASGKLLPW
jgi:poly-gamma-glutamate capsule biosynthesis protein CapA/YwtB (metallophosphatase superfamily)